MLHRNVQWDEVFWAPDGVRIRDLNLKLHCLRFCLNIIPLHYSDLEQDDSTALEEAFQQEFPVTPKWEQLRAYPEFVNACRTFDE